MTAYKNAWTGSQAVSPGKIGKRDRKRKDLLQPDTVFYVGDLWEKQGQASLVLFKSLHFIAREIDINEYLGNYVKGLGDTEAQGRETKLTLGFLGEKMPS